MAKTLDFMPGVETRKVSRPALESPSSSSLAAALLGAPDDRRAITIAAPAMIPAGVVAPCDATIAAMTRPITMIATFVPPPLVRRVCVGLTAGAGGGRRGGPRFPPSPDPLPRPRPDDLPLPSHVADRQRRGGARGEPCGQPRRGSCLAGRRSGRQRLGLEPGRVLEDRFEIRNVRGALLQTRREGSGEVRDLVRPDRGDLLPQRTLPRLSEVVADKQ